MRELPEQRVDADIARTLKFDTLVTPRQRENARERLLRCAAAQIILPPLEVVEESVTLRERAFTLRQHTFRLLNFLIMDSRVYERVRRTPRFYEYYNAHGRYAYSIIHLSA